MVGDLRGNAHRRVVPQTRMHRRLSRSAAMRHAFPGLDHLSCDDSSAGSGCREGRRKFPLEGQEEESPVTEEWLQAMQSSGCQKRRGREPEISPNA